MKIMEPKVPSDRDELYSRHRLSHQQIDILFGDKRHKELVPEKVKGLEMVRELARLADILDEANIPFTCLKGPLLSLLIYDDPTVRISRDLDILIDKKDVERVYSVLLSKGYTLGFGMHWPAKNPQKRFFMQHIHHVSFNSPETGALIEMHWKLMVLPPVSQRKVERVVAKNLAAYGYGGRTLQMLSMELTLLFLILHGAKHGWQRLKWLIDIKDFPFDKVDADKFAELVKQLNARRAVAQTGILLKHFFGMELPLFPIVKLPKLLMRRSFALMNAPVCPNPSNKECLKGYIYRFMLFEGVRYKLRALRITLFSMNDLAEIELPFLFLYYLYRPYGFVKRRLLHAK